MENYQSFFKEQTVYTIPYHKLEDLTEIVYGKRIQFLTGNPSSYEYNTNEVDSEWYKKELEHAISIGAMESWEYGIVFDDLCKKGLIKHGKYIVRVSW